MVKDVWTREFKTISNDEELVERWVYQKSKKMSYSATIRHFYSQWGSAKQFSIMKEDSTKNPKNKKKFDFEPGMEEKCDILYDLDAFDYFEEPVAFEIFPKHIDIVDDYDMYHVWIVESKYVPFIYFAPYPRFRYNWDRVDIDGVLYRYKKRRRATPFGKFVDIYYVYLEDESELSWYQKQIFKDFVMGSNAKAVELIRPDYERSKNVSILIKVPDRITIPFGLKKKRST